MFWEGPTIGFNGFSMVFEILRAMVNDGLEVNDGLHVYHCTRKCVKSILDKMQIHSINICSVGLPSIETLQCKLYTVQKSKGFPTLISPEMGTAAELMIQEERINHFP